jgi:uncharacterized protein YecE (DUF72 family)
LVEVDSTYYFPPSERNSELWIERTPKDFTFNIKAYSLLTNHPTKRESLYKDLQDELPDELEDKKNLYREQLPDAIVDEVWQRFHDALMPLHSAGKLGAVLFQFPPWFTIRRSNKQYLLEVQKRVAPLRAVYEFRHASWFEGANRDETLEFLRQHRLPYVSVDMPQGHRSSIPPVLEATADLAVVRFHGHSDKWTSKNIYETFGYEYSERELAEWAPRLKLLAEDTAETHALMNNCYSDYAQRNAGMLADLLGDGDED